MKRITCHVRPATLALLSACASLHAQTTEIDPGGGIPSGFTLAQAWEWNTDGDAEGWTGTNATVAVAAGEAAGTSTTTDPQWASAALAPPIPVLRDAIIEVRVKRPAGNTNDLLVFWADVGGGFLGARSATIPGAGLSDGNYHVVRVTCNGQVGLRIDRVRVDPHTTNAATFAIDYVRVYTNTGLQWDTNFTPGAQGGTGDWGSTLTTFWDGAGNVTWPASGTTNAAIFPLAAGTVTIESAGVAANVLSFSAANTTQATGYTLAAAAGGALTLNGTNPSFYVNGDTTITAPIIAPAGFIKHGHRILYLDGDNSGVAGTITTRGSSATNDNAAGLVFGSNASFGAITALDIQTNSFVQFNGGLTLPPTVAITLASAGGPNAPAGAIRSTGAGTVNTIQGPINVTLSGARISNNSATRLDLTGAITAGTNEVVFRNGVNEGIHLTNTGNSWTGVTTHSGGILWFEPNTLPANSRIVLAASDPGTLQTRGSFLRTLGIGVGQIRIGSGASSGRAMGFSARGGDLEVNFGNSGAAVLFNNFTANANGSDTAINTNTLVLNNTTADGNIKVVNPLDLNGAGRTIQVNAMTAELAGGLLGGNFAVTKGARGTLHISGASSWDGGLTNNNAGIVRISHSQALGDPTDIKTIQMLGSNRQVSILELTGGITVDANKTLNLAGKSFFADADAATGIQYGMSNLSGDNAWLGSVIISNTGGGYGIHAASGTLTLGLDPTTASLIRNTAQDPSSRPMEFFGGGNFVINNKIADNANQNTGVIHSGSGVLSLTRADNDFDIVPNLWAGTTEVAKMADGGSPSSLGVAASFQLGGILRYIGAGDTSNRSLTLLHKGGTLDSSGSGPLTLSSNTFAHATGDGGQTSSPVAAGSSTLTLNRSSSIAAGQGITGAVIDVGTTITAVDPATRQVTLSVPTNAASATGFAVTLTGAANLPRTLTLTGTNTGDNTLAANLTNASTAGTLGVTKTGAGKWILSGATKSYTGPTDVQAGTLGIANTFPAGSALTVNPAATLELANVLLTADPLTGIALDIDGTLNLAGPVSVTLPQAAPVGTFDVIQAAAITGDPALITGGYRGATGSSVGGTGKLTVPAGIALTWTGADTDTWQLTGTDENWQDAATNPQLFYYGDSVRFDDTSSFNTVIMTGELRPAAMTIDNDTATYTFSGAGTLSGPFKLTKTGIGTATLGGTHTFNGGITVNEGTLKPGGNLSLGANGQVITITDPGVLDTSGVMNANRDYEAVIAGDGTGDGAIINSGANHNNGFGSITLAADATIGGSGRWDLRPVTAGTADLDLAGFTLTKKGANLIALVDGSMTADGNVVINEGTLAFSRMIVSGTGNFNVNTGAILRFENYSSGSFSRPLAVTDGTVNSTGANLAIDSAVTLTGTGTFDVLNNSLTVLQAVGGTGGLTKTGAGTLILAEPSTYAGPTVIGLAGGVLQVGTQTTLGALTAAAVTNDGTLRINRPDNAHVVANEISGSGALSIGQPGAGGSWDSLVTVTGNNTFTGGVTVESGGLKIFDDSALGTNPKTIRLTNGTNGRPQLYLDGTGGDIILPADFSFVTSSTNLTHPAIGNLAGDNVIEGPFSLESGGGNTAVSVIDGTLTLNGAITANTAPGRTLILGGNPATSGTVNGVIADGGAAASVQVAGANTWTLTGPNTYSGTTQVNSGTLLVNGNQGTATGAVTVLAGATLGGTGTVGGAITVSSGGVIAPGTSLGTLTTVAGVTLNGILAIEVNGANADRLNVGGQLNITNATLEITEVNPASGPVIVIASYGGLVGTQFVDVLNKPSGYDLVYNYNSLNQIALVSTSGDYNTWAAGFPGFTDTNPASDPDNDGRTNADEYAFGLDPTKGSSVSPVTVPLSQAAGTFKYTRRLPGLTGLAYTYGYSTTLSGAFTPFTPASEATNSGSPTEEITVTVPPALLTNPRLFVRVFAN